MTVIRLLAAGTEAAPAEAQAPVSSLVWLGQAGFALYLRAGALGANRDYTVLIDPYLSDTLAKKYAGTEFTHKRLAPAPVRVEDLPPVDVVLCSHKHSDHMDPEALPALAKSQPLCRFVVPAAWRAHATDLGIAPDRLFSADANVPFEPLPGLFVTPVLAAHETLEFDDHGHSCHLGYVVGAGDLRIYHSGDCVPYEGQQATLAGLGIQVALLPVNGRDAYRLQRGVPGNFHPIEAVELAVAIGAGVLVGHHFGMFEFNTVNEADLAAALSALPATVQWLRPQVAECYEVRDFADPKTAV